MVASALDQKFGTLKVVGHIEAVHRFIPSVHMFEQRGAHKKLDANRCIPKEGRFRRALPLENAERVKLVALIVGGESPRVESRVASNNQQLAPTRLFEALRAKMVRDIRCFT